MENICAILVSRNRRNRIEGVINSLLSQTIPFKKIVVVDNNSTDGSREYLQQLANEKIKVVALDHNAGHGASIAIALTNVNLDDFDYFFFVEDDSAIRDDLVRQLLAISQSNPEYELLGSEGSVYSLGRKSSVKKSKKLVGVNFVLFSGLLVKKEVFKKAGFPRSNFFMMCDDLEFCMRVVKNGFRCGVIDLDMHQALHIGSNSNARSAIWRSYYQSRNRILLLRYHFSVYNIVDCLIWQVKFLYSALINPFPITRLRYRLLGIFHGLIGVDGFTVDPKKFT